MIRAAHILYSGRVQGIGFRFTTEHVAHTFDLTGWVRNLRDGRVEVLCEGEEEDIKRFMNMLESNFPGYIKDKELDWKEAKGKFNDFLITF